MRLGALIALASGFLAVAAHGQAASPRATYVTPSVGGEVSLFKYMTMYLTVGRRMVGEIKTPAITGAGLSGLYEQFGFGFGKFR